MKWTIEFIESTGKSMYLRDHVDPTKRPHPLSHFTKEIGESKGYPTKSDAEQDIRTIQGTYLHKPKLIAVRRITDDQG